MKNEINVTLKQWTIPRELQLQQLLCKDWSMAQPYLCIDESLQSDSFEALVSVGGGVANQA